MNYIILSPRKIRILACLSFLLFTNLQAQKPTALLIKNIISVAEIAGSWEFDLGARVGKRILNVNQTGSVAIGTFHKAPVIVNVVGKHVKFKCDERNSLGEKVRFMFKGEASDEQIFGQMTVYNYKKKTLETTDLIAVKKK